MSDLLQPWNDTNMWARAQKYCGRPVAAPLEECALYLKVPVDVLRPAAARIKPYRHADGYPVWSLYLLEKELWPGRFGETTSGVPTRKRQGSVA